MTDSGADPISWKTLRYGTPVFSSDGQREGVVREVLGSDAEDIFHGLRVTLDRTHVDVLVVADAISGMTATRVDTTLTATALDAAPPYQEAATYHMASVGWLRKHVGWKADASSDEEPG